MTRTGLCEFAILCCSVAVLAGCGSSRLSHYPEFPEHKKTMTGLTIMTDFILIDGILGDTDKVDLTENKEVAANVLQLCEDSLKIKGYQIQKTVLSSIGLLMSPSAVYRVATTVADHEASVEDLPLGSPPFYIDENVNDTTRRRLSHIYNSLINSPEKAEGTTTIVPEAARLGDIGGKSKTLMVLLAGGVNVPVSKAIGERFANPNPGEGVVAVQRISQFSVMLFILDMNTGEVIWDDRKHVQGGLIFQEKIYSMLGDLLEELP